MSKQPPKSDDLAFDLKDLGFGEDGETPEPDTGVVISTIVEDQKTPGNTKSFLAIFGYQRGIRREVRDLRHWIGVRMAWAFGFIAAVLFALEVYRSFKGGH